MDFNFKDFKRFEKQIILKNIGIRGQKRIFKSRVLIIGVGGLGCPLLTYLAASGVGTLGIVDYDRIELSNLNRQTLFLANDVGKFKVNQAKINIRKINRKIKIKTYKKKITPTNINPIIKGKGSAIFIHIANKNYKKTHGCVAVSKVSLLKIIKNLKKGSKIMIGNQI